MFFSELPDELKLQIFSYCDVPTLSKNASVSKEWQRLTSDDSLWHKHFSSMANNSFKKAENNGLPWQAIFKYSYQELFDLADHLYEIMYTDKPDGIRTSIYAKDFIEAISQIVDQAVSSQALFHILIKKHPDILTRTDNHRHLALHWFAACGYPEALRLLLMAGKIAQMYTLNSKLCYALVNLRNKEGFTPLHFALTNYPLYFHPRLVEVIGLGLAYEADLTMANVIDGATFLEDFQGLWESQYITDEQYNLVNDLIQKQAQTLMDRQLAL